MSDALRRSEETALQRLLDIVLVLGFFALGLLVALVANYLFAIHVVLRIRNYPSPDFDGTMTPVAEPIVLTPLPSQLPALGIVSRVGAHRPDLPTHSKLLIEIDDVDRANPHPNLAATNRGDKPAGRSFGYLGTDGRYHQLTVYLGMAPTTPSWLFRDRGVEGGTGTDYDYFLCYTVYLSRAQPGALEPGAADPSGGIQVDRVNWSAYHGAGGDGERLDEFLFAAGATAIEIPALLFGLSMFRRRRRGARTR
jgi:hypothetical protein